MTTLRTMTPADAPAVLAIYAEGIATGHATFESAAPDWVHFDDGKLTAPRLVAVDDGGLVTGWAALSPCNGTRGMANAGIIRGPRECRGN